MTILAKFILSPPKKLSLIYARADLRDVFGVMLALDERLSEIMARTSEPMIGQIRMAWWNDVIAKPTSERPAGEPLLAIVSAVEAAHKAQDIKGPMIALVEAWSMLLANEIWASQLLMEFAEKRYLAIFGALISAGALNNRQNADVRSLGLWWALRDLRRHCHNDAQLRSVETVELPQREIKHLPRILRPLTILAKSLEYEQEVRPFNGVRLLWHAVTGY